MITEFNMNNYSKRELTDILKDESINEELFSYADKIREDYVGNEVHLRGLIEFSNVCKNTCKYCGLRSENKIIKRYSLTVEEIISCAKNAVDLVSGDFSHLTERIMLYIVFTFGEMIIAIADYFKGGFSL